MQTSVIFETLQFFVPFYSFHSWQFDGFHSKPTTCLSLFRGLSLKGLGSGKKGLNISWNYNVFKLVCAQLGIVHLFCILKKSGKQKLLLQHFETQMTPFLKNVQHSRWFQMIKSRDHNRTGLDLRSRPFDSGAPNDNFRKISVRKTIWDLKLWEHFFQNFLLVCFS